MKIEVFLNEFFFQENENGSYHFVSVEEKSYGHFNLCIITVHFYKFFLIYKTIKRYFWTTESQFPMHKNIYKRFFSVKK